MFSFWKEKEDVLFIARLAFYLGRKIMTIHGTMKYKQSNETQAGVWGGSQNCLELELAKYCVQNARRT